MKTDPMVAAGAFLSLADDAMQVATAEARQLAQRIKDAAAPASNGRVGICALFMAVAIYGEVILQTPPEGHSGLIH